MGKSPGKWIKTLLFGKKSFKSRSSKGRPSGTNSMDLTADGGSDLTANSLVISDPIPVNTSQVGSNLELEKEALACVYGGECALEERESTVSKVLDDPKRTLQEQAAIKAQAAFRGYLSRRAFRALKGIIRLQALIRGHLVRRQAVATLHCMRAIVSIQALVRSKRVTHDKGVQVAKHADPSGRNLSSGRMKASTNAFVRKLLGSQTTARPLKISYHLESPNSAWSWLERWSTSRFWRPPPQKKKAVDPKPQRRHHNMEMESGRPKRSVRRNFGANTESGSHGMVASDPEKPRRNLRKVSTHPSEVVVDNPQGDLEKVKRNLRRISSVAGDSSDRGAHETDRAKAKMTVTNGGPPDLIEVESEKAKISSPKVSSPTANAPVRIANGDAEEAKSNKGAADLIPEPIQNPQTSSNITVVGTNVSATEILVDSDAVSAENTEENGKMSTDDGRQNEEAIPLPAPTEEPAEAEGCTVMTPHPPENGATEESTPRGLSNLEEQASHESHKTFKRRDSFSAKPECAAENIVQNSPVLPSYMATTESAKAKARGQSSPRLSTEGVDKTAFTRRHSLPSSTNGKPTSLSPRTQRLAPTSCKGGIRSERSLLSSSRDNGTGTML